MCILIIEVAAVLALLLTGQAQSVPATPAPAMPPVIVIGFVGGFISHDNPNHSEVQLGGASAPGLSLRGGGGDL